MSRRCDRIPLQGAIFPLLLLTLLAALPRSVGASERQVADRVVICFDEASFLREITAWDDERFWPVLLWDSGLVPKFIEAFRPGQVLLAEYAPKPGVSKQACLDAVADAWGVERGGKAASTRLLLDALEARGSLPRGAVLLSESSPELLGGTALAAGRFHIPLFLETEEKQRARVALEKAELCRSAVAELLDGCGIAYREPSGDLDFLVVANDMPFGYVPSDPRTHPGGYTLDDLLARGGDSKRWAATGRLVGGPARSVYMAMCAFFLQPDRGLFFSRYTTQGQGAFAFYSPKEAPALLGRFFPADAVRHPDATLAKWREIQWPEGNRSGFLHVNSSGGAANWSTSKGNASFFDVPETVPAVVHYTHSGSAAQPFNSDSIAGRWLENGAFIYFGSYAEPYLTAFVPPDELARRVVAGMPLGAAMRHPYSGKGWAERQMKKDDPESRVRFNVSAPWKLAYFGDPSYRLTGINPKRLEPERRTRGYFATTSRFRRARRTAADQKAAHRLAKIGIVLIEEAKGDLVNDSAWLKTARTDPGPELAGRMQREMTRVWVTSIRRAGAEALHAERSLGKLLRVPRGLQRITREGGSSVESGRIVAAFAKEFVAGLSLLPDIDKELKRRLAGQVLGAACCFEHSAASAKPLFAWINETCTALGVETSEVKETVLENDWISQAAREAVTRYLAKK